MLKEILVHWANYDRPSDYVNKLLYIRTIIKRGGARKQFAIRKYNRICHECNSFIPTSAQIGDGIVFPHGIYGIFISQNAILGKNCVVFHQVTIGSNMLEDSKNMGAPIIGDNVYIGAGAKIIGKIRVGNYVRIGANAVVTKDIPDNATVVADGRIIEHKERRNNCFIRVK